MIIGFEEQIAQKSTPELVTIFRNSDDYQEQYVQLVYEELLRRNYDPAPIAKEREESHAVKDEAMAGGIPGNKLFIVFGFVSAFLGGFIGIIAGYIYSQSKHKSNPRGEFYVYNEQTRQLGLAMMIIGIIVMGYSLLNHFY